MIGKRKRRSAWGEPISAAGFDDAACGGERDQAFVETGEANAAYPAQFGDRHVPIGVCECGDDAIVEGSRRRRLWAMAFDGLECQRIGAVGEFEREGRHRRCGAVLDSEGDLTGARVTVAAKVEIRVAPGVKLGGPAQRLAAADATGAFLGVVDDDDGEIVSPLQLTQPGEERSNLARGIFVDAMQTHEGIEHEQAGSQPGDGLLEASAIGLEIEAQGGDGDHLNVEINERDA